ncbi:hypothetical protein L596_011795 [Steinernema carpocapsae]|uniref:Uncharacterized protein n=1 Tax=Steinernema carpocapsae TaxID=34508 RepID=A0A4U5NVI9_STECR|nr:hypothetical protein L596_011795 [Steinernema carpocapsae]
MESSLCSSNASDRRLCQILSTSAPHSSTHKPTTTGLNATIVDETDLGNSPSFEDVPLDEESTKTQMTFVTGAPISIILSESRNKSGMSKKSVQFATPIAMVKSVSSLCSSNASDRRLCRICQSETGQMVRPCACAGTMGDIHETCLNTWVQRSQKDTCEICKERYAKTGKIFLPFKQWKKPRIGPKLLAFSLLLASFVYVISVWTERSFGVRLVLTFPRLLVSDFMTFYLLLTISIFLIKLARMILSRISLYLNKQRVVRFKNHEGNRGPNRQT